jgi:hypothetical protein
MSKPSETDIWIKGAALFAVATGVWLVFLLISPPRFPGGDITCFKDPGINWALGNGLVETITPSNPTLTPLFYSNYPPLFPMLYGLYVYLFGSSEKTDEIFDFALAAIASVLFWFFLTPRYGDQRSYWIALLIALVLIASLTVGPFWTQRERPDMLGVIMFILSLFIIRNQQTSPRVYLAGFLAGVGCWISPFVFLLNCAAIGILLCVTSFSRPCCGRQQVTHFLNIMTYAGVGITIPVVALIAIQGFHDPDALARLASNATGSSTGGKAGLGYILALFSGDVLAYSEAFSRYSSIRYKWMLGHLIFVVIMLSAVLITLLLATRDRKEIITVIALPGFALIPVILFPYQPCYMSLTALLAVLLFASIYWQREKHTYLIGYISLACVVFIGIATASYTFRDFIYAFRAQDSYAEASLQVATLKAGSNSSRPLVATTAHFYFLFKNAGFDVVEVAYLRSDTDIRSVDFFAFPRGAEIHYFPSWWNGKLMERIEDAGSSFSTAGPGLNRQPHNVPRFDMFQTGPSWLPALYRFRLK